MRFKNISKLLVFGLLFNSLNMNSFAGTLSSDTRYETFEGSNITVNDVLEEDEVDIEIEGNSLVNLANIKSSFEIRDLNKWYNNFSICETSSLKLNTDYTLIIYKEFLDNHNEKYRDFEIGVSSKIDFINKHPQLTINGEVIQSIRFDIAKPKEIVKVKVNFNDFLGYKYLAVRPIRRSSEPVSTEYANANIKLVLLEGDYTGEDIDYFEGMESSFEDQLVTQEMVDSGEEKPENLGKYKVEVKSIGKNLFNRWISGCIGASDGINYDRENSFRTDFIPIDNAKSYYIGGLYNICSSFVAYYDSNCNYIRRTAGARRSSLLLTGNNFDLSTGDISSYIPENCSYIKLTIYSLDGQGATAQDILDNTKYLQLEEGSIATEYEPYQESIKTFYLDEPLRSLPNGVKDRIIKRNGQWVVERKLGQTILNGEEKWSLEPNNENQSYNIYRMYLNFPPLKSGRANMLSDKFKFKTSYTVTEETGEGFFGSLYGASLYIDVFKEKIDNLEGSTVVEKFKKWLSENPVTIVYELAEPIHEPLNINSTINLFEGVTHITNKSNISANMKVIVDRTLNRASEAIELVKTNQTVQNIAQARYWSNLLKESSLKDQLQDQLNNIVEVKDLEIEKKTTSVNTDVYIKFKNTLSMSLNTNFITFENYSGVEDMEMHDALELSVSSSLPYDLNAYLETEIQNADKSKTLDKSALSIKESSSSDYKSFVNTSDKLVLKENCSDGNFVVHNIDVKLNGGIIHDRDVYKTTVKFEVEQK